MEVFNSNPYNFHVKKSNLIGMNFFGAVASSLFD
jgi:hypothetical protein